MTIIQIANTVSVSLVSSFIIPILFYAHTSDRFYLKLLGGLVAANILVECVKPLLGSAGIFGRPVGATACDAFCNGGDVGGRPGFPSGHMTNVSMLISAMWFHTRSPMVLWIGVPWIGAMAWARWRKRCHNWQQIVAGIGFGSVFGFVFGFVFGSVLTS